MCIKNASIIAAVIMLNGCSEDPQRQNTPLNSGTNTAPSFNQNHAYNQHPKDFQYVQKAAQRHNVTSAEGFLALDELRQFADSLTPSWNVINGVSQYKYDVMEPAGQARHAHSYVQFWDGIRKIQDAILDLELAKTNNCPLSFPSPDASNNEVSKYLIERQRIFNMFHPDRFEKYSPHSADHIASKLGFNASPTDREYKIDSYNKDSEKFNSYNKYNTSLTDADAYANRAYGTVVFTCENEWVYQYINRQINAINDIDVVTSTTKRNLLNLGFNSKKPNETIEFYTALLNCCAFDGLFHENFSTLSLTRKIIIRQFENKTVRLIDADTSYFNAEKTIITEMIKTGRFKGLFNYLIDKSFKVDGKDVVAFTKDQFDKLVAVAPASLAADITPSTLGRSARQGVTGVDASHLYMNGVPAGKVEMALPISINFKGKIDGAKSTAGMSGVVAYKVGNTVLGIVHAYANKGEGFESNSHQSETSVAISQSIGNAFIEGQVGYIGTYNVHNADLTGTRYYLSVGFDTQYVSPFVQVAYRDFGAVNNTAAYVGGEVNIDSLKADTYSFDMSLNAKAGYDSQSAFTGCLEWSASLNLNSGISFKTDLTFGTNDGSSVGLTANLTR